MPLVGVFAAGGPERADAVRAFPKKESVMFKSSMLLLTGIVAFGVALERPNGEAQAGWRRRCCCRAWNYQANYCAPVYTTAACGYSNGQMPAQPQLETAPPPPAPAPDRTTYYQPDQSSRSDIRRDGTAPAPRGDGAP
jgi:hypothetical protein